MDASRKMDRRRFVRLLAAGAAAAAAAPLAAAGEAGARQVKKPDRSSQTHRPLTAAVRKELEAQKKSLADALKIIRAYELPAGSPPASIFHPIRAKRKGR